VARLLGFSSNKPFEDSLFSADIATVSLLIASPTILTAAAAPQDDRSSFTSVDQAKPMRLFAATMPPLPELSAVAFEAVLRFEEQVEDFRERYPDATPPSLRSLAKHAVRAYVKVRTGPHLPDDNADSGPRDPRGAQLAPLMGTRGSARMRPCLGRAAAHGYTPGV